MSATARRTADHRHEFPKVNWLPRRLLEAFARNGWRDTSWTHDACPTFQHDGSGTVVFCEARSIRGRELGGPRYQIVDADAIDVAAFDLTDALIEWLDGE